MAKSDARQIPIIRAVPAGKLPAIGQPVKFGDAVIGEASRKRRNLAELKAPNPYPWTKKASFLANAGITGVKLATPLNEFTLSVREPYVAFGGMLGFFNVVDYLTQNKRAVLYMSDVGGGSFFGIRVNSAPAGARYLLDVVVSGPLSSLASTPAGTTVPVDSNGHALFVVTAAAQGDCGITLIVLGEDMYNFHRVVVSRIS